MEKRTYTLCDGLLAVRRAVYYLRKYYPQRHVLTYENVTPEDVPSPGLATIVANSQQTIDLAHAFIHGYRTEQI